MCSPPSRFRRRGRPRRFRSSLGSVLGAYAEILRDRRFLGLAFIGGFGMSSFFAFLATSSFVYIDHFGLTPMQYGLAFSVNAVGFIGAAQFAGRLGQRFGLPRVVAAAVAAYTILALSLFALTAAGFDSLGLLMTLLFLTFAGLGLVVPSTAVLAMDRHGPLAGTASAMMGTLHMVTGAAVVALVSLFFDGTALPMVTVIALCALGAFLLSRILLAGPAPARAPAE